MAEGVSGGCMPWHRAVPTQRKGYLFLICTEVPCGLVLALGFHNIIFFNTTSHALPEWRRVENKVDPEKGTHSHVVPGGLRGGGV